MSIAMATAGFTGVGKTTFVKQTIADTGLQPFIFDIHKEYNMQGSFYGGFKAFLEKAKTQENKFIVFEEATIFFKQQGIAQDAMDILVNKRHMGKPYGCVVMFNFHSLRKVPLDIMDLINYLTIFKTNDMDEKVLQKFGDEWGVYDAYQYVKESTNPHEKITLQIQPAPPM